MMRSPARNTAATVGRRTDRIGTRYPRPRCSHSEPSQNVRAGPPACNFSSTQRSNDDRSGVRCGAVDSGIRNAPPVTADMVLTSFLSGSTDALVMGPTGFPDPADYPGFLSTVDQLYLDPLGFEGQSTALMTPETFDFGPSVAEGEQDLISAVTQQYDAGDFSAADPLTIFGYSQRAVVASLAEPQLADDGIPSDALRFVLIGDT